MGLFSQYDPPPKTHDFELNDDQSRALNKIRAFQNNDGAEQFGLFGAAGTGKTTVVARAFDKTHWIDPWGQSPVCLSAPTHKAVGVLRSKADRLPCATIHSLLGCKKHYNEDDGTIEFLPTPDNQPISEYQTVVIDECSMIGEQLFGWITDAATRWDVNLIWLGDPYQLPPVQDGTKAPAFDVERQFELTEIMRHKGVIQSAADAVRLAIQEGRRAPVAEPGRDGDGEIVEYANNENGIDRMFAHYQDHVEGDTAKILAYKNDDVAFCNSYLRGQLYGADAAPFVEGEKLVVVSTCEIPDGPGILHTGTDLIVEDARPDTREGLSCWRLDVRTFYGQAACIWTLKTKKSKRLYRKRLDRLKSDAKGTGSWKPYFSLKEAFARVRPGYATTVHKSQGSSYDRVYFLQSEMIDLWDSAVRDRLLYVAYSRAKKGLYLV